VIVSIVQSGFTIFGDKELLVSVRNFGGNSFKGRLSEGKDICVLIS
jgi:hypothetical protein